MRKSKLKKIEPGSGLGEVRFGLSKEEVIKLIGEPDKSYQENFGDAKMVEVWDYDELGLSLKFEGAEVSELNSMSIISSYYEYNGQSIIGRTLESVSKILKDEIFHKIFHKDVPEKSLLYVPNLNLIVWFEYDVATSLSWDTSEVEVYLGKKYTKKQGREVKKKISAYRKVRNRSKKIEEERRVRDRSYTGEHEVKLSKENPDLPHPLFVLNTLNILLITVFGYFSTFGSPSLFGSLALFFLLIFLISNYLHIKNNPKE